MAAHLRGPADVELLLGDGNWAPTDASWEEAAHHLRAIRSLDIQIIAPWAVPARLQRVVPLPALLFVRGEMSVLHRAAVGIVGARRAHASAERWAYQAAQDAAEAGLVTVSGGAAGVDAAAHLGALEARGATVVYLGVAIDRSYPAAHKPLFARIIRGGGAVVSEHAPGEHTFASAHALRNRFIAAHAERLLVAEAALDSGSLGTARFARRFGTPITVSPPGVGTQRSGIDRLGADGHAEVSVTPLASQGQKVDAADPKPVENTEQAR